MYISGKKGEKKLGMGKEEASESGKPSEYTAASVSFGTGEKLQKKRVRHADRKNLRVSHSPVSRYLQFCCEKGYLTEDYEFH